MTKVSALWTHPTKGNVYLVLIEERLVLFSSDLGNTIDSAKVGVDSLEQFLDRHEVPQDIRDWTRGLDFLDSNALAQPFISFKVM